MGRGKKRGGQAAPPSAVRPDGFTLNVRRGVVSRSLYINGGRILTYRYPHVDARFASPLLNYDNLHLCGGWHWPPFEQEWPWSVSDTPILDRVLAKSKPLGSMAVSADGLEDAERLKGRAEAAGLATLMQPRDHPSYPWHLVVSRTETFGQLFDLRALGLDWQEYFQKVGAAPHLADYWPDFFPSLADTPVSAHLEWDERKLPIPLMGLILGYPVESSVAFYCSALELPGLGIS